MPVAVTAASQWPMAVGRLWLSSGRDGGCDFFKWYDGKMCDRATELLRQLRDSERNLLKDNLALRKNAMDLVTFDG
ncbi:hypothetical protein PVK06_043462 [Gossypium arboreum]|uniref:Zinc finger GRF-type domain-containing protein n=1 Tax=Gossypium arboreum TaxID=29729 RepID=A0ABR0MNH5_GOSAR|nr:hypothetical protein PVK06_043462 [Gossypium arboreum]